MGTTMPVERLPIVVYTAAPASLYDVLYAPDGSTADMGGDATAFMFVRPLSSRTPVVNGNAAVPLSPPDLENHNVRYDWQPADITATGEGDFFGWWRFTPNGASEPWETMEFPILFSDHGPGLGTDTGAIVDGAAMYMPVTFDYLQKDSRFGDRRMQRLAELVKMKVLGYTMQPDQEELLPIVLLDFLSKRVALDLITPGVDFWSRQLRVATSSQTQETSSFPDMIASLKLLRASLARELVYDWRQVQLLIPGTPNRMVVPMPASSMDGSSYVTKNPQENPRLRTGWTGWGFDGLGVFPFP